jgi:hypothetical protein
MPLRFLFGHSGKTAPNTSWPQAGSLRQTGSAAPTFILDWWKFGAPERMKLGTATSLFLILNYKTLSTKLGFVGPLSTLSSRSWSAPGTDAMPQKAPVGATGRLRQERPFPNEAVILDVNSTSGPIRALTERRLIRPTSMCQRRSRLRLNTSNFPLIGEVPTVQSNRVASKACVPRFPDPKHGSAAGFRNQGILRIW